MHNLFCMNNMNFQFDGEANYIYCDPIYEDLDYCKWIGKYWEYLAPNSIFCIQTDYHTCPDVWHFMKKIMGAQHISHSVWKNEWGNHDKRKPHECFDDILIFSNGKDWKFYPERIQIDKVTKNKGLNPSGRQTKTATAWIDDVCLTTTSKERVKKDDGHLVRWQKPQKLYDRIIAPFTDENDLVLDPFCGSGSLGLWCKRNFRDYVGIENDPEVFKLAQKNIEGNAEIEYQMGFGDLVYKKAEESICDDCDVANPACNKCIGS
jgi:DNA modification methylase